MATTPVNFKDFSQTGRTNAPDARRDRVGLTYNADFSDPAQYDFNLSTVNDAQVFGICRALFVDNGSNPDSLSVWVRGTEQYFTIPAAAAGVFTINATEGGIIEIACEAGGAVDVVTITLYNYEIPPVVWYAYGASNTGAPQQVSGANPSGTVVATALNANPVYVAGRYAAADTILPIRVDADGSIFIAGSVSLSGAITIADGGDATQGFKADAAITNPASSGTVIAFLKGILTGINTAVTSLASILTAVGVLARPATGTKTTVAGSNVSGTILAANANRQGATIYNDSSAILYLALASGTASSTSYTIQVAAAGYYEVPGRYTGIITGVWASSTGNARVTEIA